VVSEPASSISIGNFLKIHVLRSHLRQNIRMSSTSLCYNYSSSLPLLPLSFLLLLFLRKAIAMYPMLAWNSQPYCLSHPPSAGITNMNYHTQLNRYLLTLNAKG
jgi:hypothetical protein